jgi:outer membrane immunogenic protein
MPVSLCRYWRRRCLWIVWRHWLFKGVGFVVYRFLLLAGLALVVSPFEYAFAAPATVAGQTLDRAGQIWDRFYIGANVGYSWGRSTETTVVTPLAGLPMASGQAFNGWLGGLQAGRNWQTGFWLYGIESDVQITGEKANATASGASGFICEPGCDAADIVSQTLTNKLSLPWFATFRARFGTLLPLDPSILLYATGGLAVGSFTDSQQSTVTCQRFFAGAGPCLVAPAGSPPLGMTAPSESATQIGWAIGGGIERHVNDHWSVKLEYLYIDYGSHTFFGGTANAISMSLRDQVFRLGFNYGL